MCVKLDNHFFYFQRVNMNLKRKKPKCVSYIIKEK